MSIGSWAIMGFLQFLSLTLIFFLLDTREVFPVISEMKNVDLLKFWMTVIQITLSALTVLLVATGIALVDRVRNIESEQANIRNQDRMRGGQTDGFQGKPKSDSELPPGPDRL